MKKKIVSTHSDVVEVHDFKEMAPAIRDSVDNLTRSCVIECRHTLLIALDACYMGQMQTKEELARQRERR